MADQKTLEIPVRNERHVSSMKKYKNVKKSIFDQKLFFFGEVTVFLIFIRFEHPSPAKKMKNCDF